MRNLLFVLVLLSGVLFAQGKGPVMDIPETDYDFGDIAIGDEVTHNFVIRNGGDEDLLIKRVKASCGCTAVSPEKKLLKPGESTNIGVVFDTKGRKGKQRKSVYVETNDPKNPKARLAFTANIVTRGQLKHHSKIDGPKIKLSKNQHHFGDVEQGSVLEVVFEVINTGTQDLLIKRVKTNCGCTAALLSEDNIKPGDRAEIKVTFDTKGRRGKNSKTVTIYSNDPDQSKIHYKIFANIIEQEG